ncbi:hypothetical protein HanHA300_Chr06g0195191 [Helianthus annuus]|nr:hypothetical protein HanHA300_Chr06g0195191 [Helianthus annuus]KAJ0571902.1 hypothetical protein HanHA89_Chr06g0209981 [Helianthus annuus]KAJ0736369.1 hypothetical protein HanLR1_Chr06g0195261 [Helianthus annuus]KAJ0739320.1 hypothetical protein HanOQP8_Chr06g0204561 [Helianthus annuus]
MVSFLLQLLEFLIDGGQVLDTLHAELSNKRHNVNKIKEEVDQGSALGGLVSILVASFKLEGSKNVVIAEEAGQAILTDHAFADSQSTIERIDFVATRELENNI